MGQGERRPLQDAPHQIDAANDVAPLIAAANLHRAVVTSRQFNEIVRLQQHVAELRVGDAGAGAIEPYAHGVALHHGVDGEVLAHVAQEGDGA